MIHPVAVNAGSSDPPEIRRRHFHILLLIVLASLLVKLAFIAYLDDRVYRDVVRAVTFGYGVDQGILSIHRDSIRTKTFLGPFITFQLLKHFGIGALHSLNLVLFLALITIHIRLGRSCFDHRVVFVALFLFAFYPGTNRNVIAGEADDHLATLFFSLGILLYLTSKNNFLSALSMGAAFLFKFWIAIFCSGFVVYLLTQKLWKETIIALTGMLLPFLLLNAATGYSSFDALLSSLKLSRGYSGWSQVGFKMLSTGMLPAASISLIQWWKNKTNFRSLLFLVSSLYVVYVVIYVDAFAASYVMMCCLFFWSFLIAEWLVGSGKRWLVPALVFYLVICCSITYHNLQRDTEPLVIVTKPELIQKMFP